MPDLPNSLALTTIADDAEILASDHRNNYSDIQAAVNALITALSGGTSGQVLQATDSDTVAWKTTPQVQVSASPTIATATATCVPFTSEDFDTDTMHDNASNTTRLTCKTAGTYLAWANANWANHATGLRYIYIGKNGAGTAFAGTGVAGQANDSVATSANSWQSTLGVVVLAANDYLELSAYHEEGSNLTPSIHFGMTRIG